MAFDIIDNDNVYLCTGIRMLSFSSLPPFPPLSPSSSLHPVILSYPLFLSPFFCLLSFFFFFCSVYVFAFYFYIKSVKGEEGLIMFNICLTNFCLAISWYHVRNHFFRVHTTHIHVQHTSTYLYIYIYIYIYYNYIMWMYSSIETVVLLA